MNKTLYELRLKFIIKNKESGQIVATFINGEACYKVFKTFYNTADYEVKESY